MLHRKIIGPALANLPKDRSAYFSDVVDVLEKDPRTQARPNMVFLVLKETMALLPTHLTKKDFANMLLTFVGRHHQVLNTIIFDRRFIENPAFLRHLTNDLVKDVIETTLERCRDGELQTGDQSFYRMRFPSGEGHFPYTDEEEDADEEE